MHSMSSAMLGKNTHREESTSCPVPTAKRRRVTEVESTTDSIAASMEATELASAFALASLATLSPVPKKEDQEARDAVEVSWESRSTKQDPVPISPEVRAPDIRSKKVHFAPGIKDVHRTGPRRESFPPRVSTQGSKLPLGFPRGSPRATRQHARPYLPSDRAPTMPSYLGRMKPPQAYPSTQGNHQDNEWICDYCNVASFPTFQEACVHEQVCRAFCATHQSQQRLWHPLAGHSQPKPVHFYSSPNMLPPPQIVYSEPVPSNVVEVQESSASSAESRTWFDGSISLANPKSDPEWLSELNCYLRETCVEAFSATEEDSSRNTKRGRISAQQVGIRCCFCMHRPLNERAIGAVSFPASVSGIYESVKRWQRVHLQLCCDIPEDAKDKLTQLSNANVWVPTTRQYWADSARSLGMVDTDCGIRFRVDLNRTSTSKDGSKDAQSPTSQQHKGISDKESVVGSTDMNMVPPYVYFLMRQVESCHFTEADRFVARSKGPVGYPGFQCRHCHGHAGLGKYFPVTAKSLSTNSTSQNIHAHVLKCRKVPTHIKEQLIALKEEKGKAPRLEPGWRKVFFDMVWGRLHGTSPAEAM